MVSLYVQEVFPLTKECELVSVKMLVISQLLWQHSMLQSFAFPWSCFVGVSGSFAAEEGLGSFVAGV